MWSNRLSPDAASEVRALASRAGDADGVAPLNEDAHFALDDDSAQHLLLTEVSGPQPAAAGPDPRNPAPGAVGYLQWQPRHGTAQLVVDPSRRRQGIGSRLLAELATRTRPELWAFGDLTPARGFAAAHTLVPIRTLLMMSRPLAGIQPSTVPQGVTLRGYTDADAADLLAVNAAAFAHHPEQGALDADGLAKRMAEPWFDPEGLILALDADGLAGFHWTKAEDGVGEVYVVGVHPRAQGRGYGRLLLDAGLSHLADKGLRAVELYVDAADGIAVRMYERAGFAEAHRDVLYAHNQE